MPWKTIIGFLLFKDYRQDYQLHLQDYQIK